MYTTHNLFTSTLYRWICVIFCHTFWLAVQPYWQIQKHDLLPLPFSPRYLKASLFVSAVPAVKKPCSHSSVSNQETWMHILHLNIPFHLSRHTLTPSLSVGYLVSLSTIVTFSPSAVSHSSFLTRIYRPYLTIQLVKITNRSTSWFSNWATNIKLWLYMYVILK